MEMWAVESEVEKKVMIWSVISDLKLGSVGYTRSFSKCTVGHRFSFCVMFE